MNRGKKCLRSSPDLLHGLGWGEGVHLLPEMISVVCIPGSIGVRKKICYFSDSFSCWIQLQSAQTFPLVCQAGCQGCECNPPQHPETAKALLPDFGLALLGLCWLSLKSTVSI